MTGDCTNAVLRCLCFLLFHPAGKVKQKRTKETKRLPIELTPTLRPLARGVTSTQYPTSGFVTVPNHLSAFCNLHFAICNFQSPRRAIF
jgi:hypothetical protein